MPIKPERRLRDDRPRGPDCRGNKCGTVKNDLDAEGRAAESDEGKIREKAGTGMFGQAMDTIGAVKARRRRMMEEL